MCAPRSGGGGKEMAVNVGVSYLAVIVALVIGFAY